MSAGDPSGPTLPSGIPVGHLHACGNATWPSVAAVANADLSVAVTPTGPTLFSVPTSGGDLRAFSLDTSQTLLSAPGGTLVRSGPFTASAAAYVDDTLIAAVVSSSRVLVHVVPTALDTYSEIANLDGNFVGKTALLHATADRITPTACSAGLTINPFTGWSATASQFGVVTGNTTGLAATPMGNEALVAWSTASTCNVERVMNLAAGIGSNQPWACTSPRLAYDSLDDLSVMLFEAADGVHLASITNDMLSSSSTLLIPGATSPRIVFDGLRYWLGYRDATGELQVGAFDDAGGVTVVATGISPAHDAFELAIVNGQLWTYAVAGTTYTGMQLCVD